MIYKSKLFIYFAVYLINNQMCQIKQRNKVLLGTPCVLKLFTSSTLDGFYSVSSELYFDTK